jgi:hypothetical protein
MASQVFLAREAPPGLFNYVVPRDEVVAKAVAIGTEIATNCSPLAVALCKTLMDEGLNVGFDFLWPCCRPVCSLCVCVFVRAHVYTCEGECMLSLGSALYANATHTQCVPDPVVTQDIIIMRCPNAQWRTKT